MHAVRFSPRSQRTWEKRGKGVELVQVLEEINGWLEKGIITGEQFQELMSVLHAEFTASDSAGGVMGSSWISFSKAF